MRFKVSRGHDESGWSSSGGQTLVEPPPRRGVLKGAQLRLCVLLPGEHDAVVEPVGLTLPELDQVGLDDVAAPVDDGRQPS